MSKYDSFRTKDGGGWKQIPPGKIISWVQTNFDYKSRKNGEEYLICDPFSGDTKYKFGINPEMGVCHSWHGDEWAGPVNPKTGKRNCSIVKFVRVFRKCSYREALTELLGASEDLSSYMKIRGRTDDLEMQKDIAVALPGSARLLSTSTDPQAPSLRKWLQSRGYADESIEKSELYHLGMNVYWPYFEFETLVYWQARSRMNKRFEFPDANQYDKSGEIIGKTEGSKGDFFYGFDNVEPASYLIIVEAIFCQNTIADQCLASGGADLTKNQIKKLKILGPRKGIILSPDNDDAGMVSVVRNNQMLQSLNVPIYCSIPPRLKYVSGGEAKVTKDWNELFTGKGLSLKEIRKIHDGNIKKITPQLILQLKRQVKLK